MTPRMVVGIFVIAVENTPTDRAAGQQQLDEMLQKHPRAPPPPPPPPPPPAPPPRPPPPRRSRQCRSGPAGAVAVAGPWPTGGGGRDPSRPKENFATAPSFLMKWCVKSPRTDGVADDRTRWPCALCRPW